MPTDTWTAPVVLSDDHSPCGALRAAFLRDFSAGTHPVSKARRIDHVKANATLLAANAEHIRTAQTHYENLVLSSGKGWSLLTSTWGTSADLTVTATTETLADEVLDAACADATDQPPDTDSTVTMGFWSLGTHHANRIARRIEVEPWESISRNYTAAVADAFGALSQLRPDQIVGRLLLLHGPPGTGKTTALRALASSWRAWCDVEYVLDPETLLAHPGYLIEAAGGDGDSDDTDDDTPRWRLLVLEDCDALIRADAAAASGQALARLLNLTDGMLGQGMRCLVAITTNEPMARLHPAIVRPGRCVAQIEVGPLNAQEAAAWLGDAGAAPSDGATLAELIAQRAGTSPMDVVSPDNAGNGYI